MPMSTARNTSTSTLTTFTATSTRRAPMKSHTIVMLGVRRNGLVVLIGKAWPAGSDTTPNNPVVGPGAAARAAHRQRARASDRRGPRRTRFRGHFSFAEPLLDL